MRGKVDDFWVVAGGNGITPAYAGKSRISGRFFFCMGDHPRVCGEKIKAMEQSAEEIGSPPRMRGKGSSLVALV